MEEKQNVNGQDVAQNMQVPPQQNAQYAQNMQVPPQNAMPQQNAQMPQGNQNVQPQVVQNVQQQSTPNYQGQPAQTNIQPQSQYGYQGAVSNVQPNLQQNVQPQQVQMQNVGIQANVQMAQGAQNMQAPTQQNVQMAQNGVAGQPSIEAISNKIYELKDRIREIEAQDKALRKEEKGKAYAYKKSKSSTKITKKELRLQGVSVKLVPVPPNFHKVLTYEEKDALTITTRSYAISAIIQFLLIVGIAAAAIVYAILNKAEDLSGVLIILGAIFIASFMIIKPINVLRGFGEVWSGDRYWLLGMTCSILYLVGSILLWPANIILSLFNITNKWKTLIMPRLGIPVGFGLDDIINEGVEVDKWASFAYVYEDMMHSIEVRDANRIIEEADKYIERAKAEMEEAPDEIKADYERNIAYAEQDKMEASQWLEEN